VRAAPFAAWLEHAVGNPPLEDAKRIDAAEVEGVSHVRVRDPTALAHSRDEARERRGSAGRGGHLRSVDGVASGLGRSGTADEPTLLEVLDLAVGGVAVDAVELLVVAALEGAVVEGDEGALLADVEGELADEAGQRKAEELTDEVRKGEKGLRLLLKNAKATLEALGVELASLEEERAEPLVFDASDLDDARAALARSAAE
jgi:hypothetical protein